MEPPGEQDLAAPTDDETRQVIAHVTGCSIDHGAAISPAVAPLPLSDKTSYVRSCAGGGSIWYEAEL